MEQLLAVLWEAGLTASVVSAAHAQLQDSEKATALVVCHSVESLPDISELRSHFRLTPTQARVAHYLMIRRTNAEIADTLGIALNTARRHVEAVLLRTGARNRWEVESKVLRAIVGTIAT